MLDLSHIPTQYPNADVQVFVFNTNSADSKYWTKPRGKAMCHILLVGAGGNGGTGLIGANSLAGGGGGGGSGAQTSVRFPLWAVPDTLLIARGATQSYVGLLNLGAVANENFVIAGHGGNGGNGTAVPAGGTGGGGGAVATAATMPLGWQWVQQAIAGQGGIGGGTNAAGAGLSIPTSGLLVTGGAGGGGLVAAATAGSNGGPLNTAGVFPALNGGFGSGSATTPAASGASGFRPIANLMYFYGGTGGASTHGSATGGGLVQSNGGDGAYGCGGGGSGAALTGSTPGVVGKGGPAFCIITCW